MLNAALEAEIDTFLSQYESLKDNKGRQRVVRNGYLPEREIQTGIGNVLVKVPRVRDRQAAKGKDAIRFSIKLQGVSVAGA